MNVLIVDMFGCSYPSLGHQIFSAFELLGHNVRSFHYRQHHLQKFSLTNRLLNKSLIKVAKSWPADLVFVSKGETIIPGTIEKISSLGCKTANWGPDEPFGELQKFNKIENVSEYDAFFMYDHQYVNRLRELNPNSYYLPACADPLGVHRELVLLENRSFPSDVCMVGTAYGNRIPLMQKFVGKRLLIAGPGWNKAPNELSSISLPPVDLRSMVRLFNQSKIVLNPHGASKSFIMPNPRTFEIPASRSFQLTDAHRDIDSFFRKGKEIIIYKTEEELLELAEYYLSHHDERLKITQASYNRVIKEHTMVHRIREILQRMNLQ
ncbi:glycosyltransferase [Candidatus Woesearchaeota archaeon]|nr:glycosyltransferase [Candidatus Woesearchaeota archaeon]